MADQRSIKSYFGAPVKQLKRKAKPTESTMVNEKKKQRDNPTARIRKFQESWKETFPWVVHDANQDVMYCSKCRRYPAFANLQSSLYTGCGSGGKYRIDSLVHHNTSKEHYRCSLQFEKDSNPQYLEPIKAVVQRNVVQLKVSFCTSVPVQHSLFCSTWRTRLQKICRSWWVTEEEWCAIWGTVQEW